MTLKPFSSTTAEYNCSECNASLYLHVQIPQQRFCTNCHQFKVEDVVKVVRQPAPQQVDVLCQCQDCQRPFKCVALLPKYQSCPHCGYMTPYQKKNLWYKYLILLSIFAIVLVGSGSFGLYWFNPQPERQTLIFSIYFLSLFLLNSTLWFFFGRYLDLNATRLAKRRKIIDWIPRKIIGKNLKTYGSPYLLWLLGIFFTSTLGLALAFSWLTVPNLHSLTTFLKITLLYSSFALFALSIWQLYQNAYRRPL